MTAEELTIPELTSKFPAVVSESEADTASIASALAGEVYGGLFVILSGEIGAGKTVLVRAMALSLGVEGVKSPTFATEYVYRVPGKNFGLVHADLYRFDCVAFGSDAAMQFEEYLSEGENLLLAEWGERWETPPVSDGWRIEISSPGGPDSDDVRVFSFDAFGERAHRSLAAAYEKILGMLRPCL
ncbi:MAG: tRNA (adenosine(37)-N6)-threonylcarbamoyltransferase complex ATPase subunit type 1 TsaE [Synergistaceae bacterium]|jgi:tRNA threonylcarbamoyladenosine biosynthesis protein TsaE|nr:tRNA (adenosine(37)-N6)-threonylcarbamoyltransferase complex ATPase subunit type 1 TsaE [Synergistaceae bacterium]